MLKDLVEKVDNWNEQMHEEFWQKDGNHKEIENTCTCPEGERVPQPEEGNYKKIKIMISEMKHSFRLISRLNTIEEIVNQREDSAV